MNNTGLNENNCFSNLIHHTSPNIENEIDIINHSTYYNDDDFRDVLKNTKSELSITLTRVPYRVDVGCYLTIQTKLLYLLSGGSVLLVYFLSSFAGTSGRFPSGGPKLSCLLHSL